MSENDALICLRAGIGAFAWTAPRLAERLLGLDIRANPQLPYAVRLLGARDMALAAGLGLSRGQGRALWLQLGMACDAADAIAGLLAARKGEISTLSTVLGTAPAVLAIGLGLAGRRAVAESHTAAA